MRCLSCNTRLTQYESTVKSHTTGDFLDLCMKCFESIRHEVEIEDRPDLITENNNVDDT